VAIGPVRFAGIAAGRLVTPTAYWNPLGDGSLATWIADPSNTYVVTSVVVVVLMGCSSLWILHGAVTFCMSNTVSFILALGIVLGLSLLMIEGGKFDPTRTDQAMFAAMLILAFLSTAGRLFAQKADKEKDEKE
jgi:hypothetical protein